MISRTTTSSSARAMTTEQVRVACASIGVLHEAYRREERALADTTCRLGAELVRIADEFGSMELARCLGIVGIHKRTAERAMRVAREFAGADGRISPDRVHKAQAQVREIVNRTDARTAPPRAADLCTADDRNPTESRTPPPRAAEVCQDAGRSMGRSADVGSVVGTDVARVVDRVTLKPAGQMSVRELETLSRASGTVERAAARGVDPCEALVAELVGGPKAQMANGEWQMANQNSVTPSLSHSVTNARLREPTSGRVIGQQMGLFDGVARRAEVALERARVVVGSRVLGQPEMDRVTGAVSTLEEVLREIE